MEEKSDILLGGKRDKLQIILLFAQEKCIVEDEEEVAREFNLQPERIERRTCFTVTNDAIN